MFTRYNTNIHKDSKFQKHLVNNDKNISFSLSKISKFQNNLKRIYLWKRYMGEGMRIKIFETLGSNGTFVRGGQRERGGADRILRFPSESSSKSAACIGIETFHTARGRAKNRRHSTGPGHHAST